MAAISTQSLGRARYYHRVQRGICLRWRMPQVQIPSGAPVISIPYEIAADLIRHFDRYGAYNGYFVRVCGSRFFGFETGGLNERVEVVDDALIEPRAEIGTVSKALLPKPK